MEDGLSGHSSIQAFNMINHLVDLQSKEGYIIIILASMTSVGHNRL